MALRFADGFDQYNAGEDELTRWWTQLYTPPGTPTAPAIVAGEGRRGGQAVKFDSASGAFNSHPLARVIADAGTTAVLGFAFRGVPSAAGYVGWGGLTVPYTDGTLFPGAAVYDQSQNPFNFVASIRNAGYTQVALCLESNGRLSAVRGDAEPTAGIDVIDAPTTTLGTTANALQFDEWNFIELTVVLHASAGSVTVTVNGDTWLSLTGINTIATNGGTAAWDEVCLGRLLGTNCGAWLFDDLYVLDTDTSDQDNDLDAVLGDVAITWSQPTADGDVNNWTPSTGAQRFAMVDEVGPDDDASYVQSATAAQVNTFATGGSPITGATIIAAAVMFLARRTEGGPSSTRPVMRIGGVTYEIGEATGNTTSYSYQAGFVNNLPSDHASISEAEFAALQPGVKKVT